jgi:hypothetical protein
MTGITSAGAMRLADDLVLTRVGYGAIPAEAVATLNAVGTADRFAPWAQR